jgi:hypothetical protein
MAVRGSRPLSPTGVPGREADAEELIAKALKEYGRLLLWDVDAMERGKPQLDLYRRFEGKGLWVEAGLTHLDALIDVIVAGADVAVLNVRTLPDLGILREAGTMTERLAFCVEERAEVLARDRRLRGLRARDLFREALRAGIPRGIYLRHSGVREQPEWIEAVEGLELYVGPFKHGGGGQDTVGRVVVDMYELV